MALNLKTETVFTDDTAAAQAPLPPDQVAPHFPQLEILECLGRGGMGVVYKARQKTLNRLVALKLLAPERVGDAKFAERFTREAQALAALNHPNIVTIHDFGQAGGFYFLLMEFVDGLNLRQLLQTRKFTPEEALAIVPSLCDALQFAHDRDIVHRDIKPENILLDKTGRVKVADFGIAKMLGAGNGGATTGEAAAPASATQSTLGTPGYSAPEQKTDPQRVDSRADIYSLGVVFYELLTGELPGKPIEPPSSRMRGMQIDVRLDEVVLHALERAPERRYQQVSEVKTAVETIATSAAPGRSPNQAEIPQPFPKWLLFRIGLPKWPARPAAGSRGSAAAAPPSDAAKAPAPPTADDLEEVRRQVTAPAIGLIVSSVLYGLFLIAGLFIWTYGAALSIGGRLGAPIPWIYVIPVILVLMGFDIVAFVGALRMRRLRNYQLAVAGSVSAMLGFGLTLPFGIWAFVVLNRREVREAFGKGHREPPSECAMRNGKPWVSYCVAFAYAGTVLFGLLAKFFLGHVLSQWLFRICLVLSCLTPLLALLLNRLATPQALRTWFKLAAWLGAVTWLTVFGFATYYLYAISTLDESPWWAASLDDIILLALIWLGAVALPICVVRLWRAVKKPVTGSGASVPPVNAPPMAAKSGLPRWGKWALGCCVAGLLLVGLTVTVYLLLGGAPQAVAAAPAIESVVVGRDRAHWERALIKAHGLVSGQIPGLDVRVGTNSDFWLDHHIHDPFQINCTTYPRNKFSWSIKSVFHDIHYREGDDGDVTGEIVLREGTLTPEPDGSYVIGEFRPEKGVPLVPLPIVVRLADESPQAGKGHPAQVSARTKPGGQTNSGPVIERQVNKPVSDFPETTDLSTPESACAAWQRATARKDAQAVSRLSWVKIDPAEEEAWFRDEETRDREGLATYLKALTESRIVEVQTWRDDLADVITFLPFPPGKGRHPYSARSFGRIGGQWKNLGEDRLPSLEAARANFEQKKAAIWEQLGEFRPETGSPVPMTGRLEKLSQQPTSPAAAQAAPRLQFRLVADGDEPSADTLPSRDGKERFRLVRDEAPVASATVTNAGQGATILVTFTKAGAKRFAEISSANIGKRLAIVLDGKVICAPTIRDTVVGGQAQITGKFTAAEAEEIAQALRAMNARQRTDVKASRTALVTTNFYIGQSSFPHGDSIEITSVSRIQEKMVVKGHYNLISADRAQLALFMTSTNRSSDTYIDQRQWTTIAKGRGDFELAHPHLYPGLPHVTMYRLDTNGAPFAGVYFGTKDEAAEERKLDPGFVGMVGLPAVDESFWETEVENLKKAPEVVIIRPSRYSGDPQTCGSVGSPHGRTIAYNIDFTMLLYHAYSLSRQRMILPASVPQGRFDLMLTLRDHPTEALQKAIQRQFGFTIRRETRETDVLWLKVKDPTLLALHASDSGSKMDFKQDKGMWAYIGFPISQVAEYFLEGMAFDKPVLLEPGLAGKFDLTFQEDAEDMQQAASNELAQAGLELVPSREPIEILVVEKAN